MTMTGHKRHLNVLKVSWKSVLGWEMCR